MGRRETHTKRLTAFIRSSSLHFDQVVKFLIALMLNHSGTQKRQRPPEGGKSHAEVGIGNE
jgi:hypothetical protein